MIPWTPEREEKLRLHAEGGLSASQIAAELGGTNRNAVIGKCYRMGVQLKGQQFGGKQKKTLIGIKKCVSGKAKLIVSPKP